MARPCKAHLRKKASVTRTCNAAKGIKKELEEQGLWSAGLLLECKKPKCTTDATDCCARRLLSCQPDFTEQKSSVQEVIEAVGCLCIFLPKFHCKLNFIEFFWGAVKKYLHTAIIPLTHSKPTFQRHLQQLMSKLYGNGNIG